MSKFSDLFESTEDGKETSQVCFQAQVAIQRRIHWLSEALGVSNAAVYRALVSASIGDLEAEVKARRKAGK